MPSAQKFIEGLAEASPTLHAVIRHEEGARDNLFLSSHDDIGTTYSVPAAYIQSAVKNGELRGLEVGYYSVDLNFKKKFIGTPEVAAILSHLGGINDLTRPNPVYCYDDNGNRIPCPD